VDVANSQGREHTKTIFEFGGVKDSHENMRRAVFEKDSKTKRDMEAICNRRCVVLNVMTGTDTQVIIAVNSDRVHDRFSPKPLPPFAGVTDRKTIVKTTEFGMIEIEFSLVCKVLVLTDATTKTENLKGLSFFDSTNMCLVTALFRSPMTCPHPHTSPMNMNQYIVDGVFTADILFLSTFLVTWGLHPSIHVFSALRHFNQ